MSSQAGHGEQGAQRIRGQRWGGTEDTYEIIQTLLEQQEMLVKRAIQEVCFANNAVDCDVSVGRWEKVSILMRTQATVRYVAEKDQAPEAAAETVLDSCRSRRPHAGSLISTQLFQGSVMERSRGLAFTLVITLPVPEGLYGSVLAECV